MRKLILVFAIVVSILIPAGIKAQSNLDQIVWEPSAALGEKPQSYYFDYVDVDAGNDGFSCRERQDHVTTVLFGFYKFTANVFQLWHSGWCHQVEQPLEWARRAYQGGVLNDTSFRFFDSGTSLRRLKEFVGTKRIVRKTTGEEQTLLSFGAVFIPPSEVEKFSASTSNAMRSVVAHMSPEMTKTFEALVINGVSVTFDVTCTWCSDTTKTGWGRCGRLVIAYATPDALEKISG